MKKKTYAIIALVAGLVGILGGFISFIRPFAWAGPIVGLIFSVLGRRKPSDGDPSTDGMLTAGLILSIISLVWTIIIFTVAACAACAAISCLASMVS